MQRARSVHVYVGTVHACAARHAEFTCITIQFTLTLHTFVKRIYILIIYKLHICIIVNYLSLICITRICIIGGAHSAWHASKPVSHLSLICITRIPIKPALPKPIFLCP